MVEVDSAIRSRDARIKIVNPVFSIFVAGT